MKKKIYKSVLRVEILSEEPLNDCLSLSDIDYETTEGHCSGHLDWESHNAEVVGKEAVNEMHKHGSDPEFFQMDGEGNSLDEEEYDFESEAGDES